MISKTYYGQMIGDLRNMSGLKDERAKYAREGIYDIIRQQSGLPFDDYGDEPERWLAWMIAHDTEDAGEARKIRDENLRLRIGEI